MPATNARAARLDYAPPPPAHRRRRFRVALWLLLLAGMVAAGVRWGPPLWRRATLLYLQRQCLRYAASPDQVVCTEPLPYGGVTPPFTYQLPDPPCLVDFAPRVTGDPPGRGPVVFLHERRTPGGVRRLVVLRRTPPGERMSWDIPVSFNVSLIDPAGLTTDPSATLRVMVDAVPPAFGDGTAAGPHLRLFAGAPTRPTSPASPSTTT